jgi:hypothetical protein
MRSILIILFFLLATVTAKSQKLQPGTFTDVKGTRVTGQISLFPSGRGPVKDEAFIEFKEDPKADPIKLSASDLRSFTVAQDSFIVAANGGWSKYALDFVRVALDGPIRIFQAQDYGGGGGGSGLELGTGIGTGFGSGGFGGGIGGGISIPIGGGSRKSKGIIYFYGSNTANMKPISNQEFADIMIEVMGDEPEAVEQIKLNRYNLGNIEKLIAYFKKLQKSNQSSNQ